MPERDISKNVRDHIMEDIISSTAEKLRAVYSPLEGLYILIMPGTQEAYAFNVKTFLQDGSAVVTRWTTIPTGTATDDVIQCAVIDESSLSKDLYIGLSNGDLCKYTGYTDRGLPIISNYESAWSFIQEELDNRRKYLKDLIFKIEGGYDSVIISWNTDFAANKKTYAAVLPTKINALTWEVSAWEVGSFGFKDYTNNIKAIGSNSGVVWQFGISFKANSVQTSINSFTPKFKIGKIDV